MGTTSEFPRFRDDKEGVQDFTTVYGYEQGRPDIIARRALGSSRMCKALCAANGIRNPLPCRDSVRIISESVYNELYLKGYRDAALETEYKNAMDELEITTEYWTNYNNLFNGVVSEVTQGRLLSLPTLQGALTWIEKYDPNMK